MPLKQVHLFKGNEPRFIFDTTDVFWKIIDNIRIAALFDFLGSASNQPQFESDSPLHIDRPCSERS